MVSKELGVADSVNMAARYNYEMQPIFRETKLSESLSTQYAIIVTGISVGSVDGWRMHMEEIGEKRQLTYFIDTIKTHMDVAVSLLSTVISISDDRKSYTIDPNVMFIDQPCSFVFDGTEFTVERTHESKVVVTRVGESDVGYRDYPERVAGNQMRFAVRVIKRLMSK